MIRTRRLAAILAADVVGFSALMERDEEGTVRRVHDLRTSHVDPLLQERRGRLVKTTGDGFLAEFASPIAAVGFAIDLQTGLNRIPDGLRLRIGINQGDIIVEEDGDVYGEGVNVAARLEALCEPGGVLVSGKIYGEVRARSTPRSRTRASSTSRTSRNWCTSSPSASRAPTARQPRPSGRPRWHPGP
ncbi:MAG: adenylate/guanylate cyclase domain-containing protein [Burkholderiales bacterium]|nr:adenylate/guanylate cyclase domain-containing protein [Burkholderiales bacterium]